MALSFSPTAPALQYMERRAGVLRLLLRLRLRCCPCHRYPVARSQCLVLSEPALLVLMARSVHLRACVWRRWQWPVAMPTAVRPESAPAFRSFTLEASHTNYRLPRVTN